MLAVARPGAELEPSAAADEAPAAAQPLPGARAPLAAEVCGLAAAQDEARERPSLAREGRARPRERDEARPPLAHEPPAAAPD
jgi:hypothetical protein